MLFLFLLRVSLVDLSLMHYYVIIHDIIVNIVYQRSIRWKEEMQMYILHVPCVSKYTMQIIFI